MSVTGEFRKKVGGCLGYFAGGLLIVFSTVGGCTEMWKKNPKGVSDTQQFFKGITFGVYDPEKYATPEDAGDHIYDGGKDAVEGTGRFLDQIRKRATEDFGGSSGGNREIPDDPAKIEAEDIRSLPHLPPRIEREEPDPPK